MTKSTMTIRLVVHNCDPNLTDPHDIIEEITQAAVGGPVQVGDTGFMAAVTEAEWDE